MRRRGLAFVIVLLACGDDVDEGTAQDESSSGTGSSTSTVTDPTVTPTTGASATDESEGGSSGAATTEGASADESTTATPGECVFASTIDEVLESVAPMDCGTVTLADDVAMWEAARQCTRDATLDQISYKVLWQYDDGGTIRDAAVASEIGRIYAIYRFDDDAADGTTSITRTTCTGISSDDRCVVAPGTICIDCIRPSEPAELCD